MEQLIRQLVNEHKLNRSEALEAIRMVTDYLKLQHPELEKLIDQAIEEGTENDDGSVNL